eukprot:COSAG01_NODE_9462_length_2440_cov_2.186245_1_plen_195_part_00
MERAITRIHISANRVINKPILCPGRHAKCRRSFGQLLSRAQIPHSCVGFHYKRRRRRRPRRPAEPQQPGSQPGGGGGAGTKRPNTAHSRAQPPARLTTARGRRGPSQLDCATQHPPEMPPKKKVVAPPKKAIVKKAAAAAAAAAAKQKATKEGVPGLGCDTIARCARTPSRVYHVPAGHCRSPRQVLAAFHHAG